MSSLVALDLSGSTCLVTGGSRGIGRATALLAARAGAHVVVHYRANAPAAESCVAAIRAAGGSASSLAGDLASADACAALVARAFEDRLSPRHLVINAGIWLPSPLAGDAEGDAIANVREQLELHVTASFALMRAARPFLAEGSSVVLVSSTAGQRGEAEYSGYAASKAAMIGLVRSWAPELAGTGIRVNAVAPGWVETDMTAEALRGAGGERARAGIPLRRVATSDDLAGPIVFLLSPLARHMNGSVLSVNGGSVLS
ncbi:MAG: SDR family oxidoreductase [Planctomycetes bacterium]|nr:SDR family oxidoreductase [Planctomycetota bacterium]